MLMRRGAAILATATATVALMRLGPDGAGRAALGTTQQRITSQERLNAQLRGKGLDHWYLPACDADSVEPTGVMSQLEYVMSQLEYLAGRREGLGRSATPTGVVGYMQTEHHPRRRPDPTST